MSPKVSVIVPVYNKVSHLATCFESILSQEYKDYELLIIDDGSNDGSEAVCLRYAKAMPEKIRYIRKDNGGVSSARNVGMDAASGEYLCFVDADDFLCPGFLSALLREADGHDITTCSSGLDRVWKGCEIAEYADTVGRSMLGTAVWGKIYRRETVCDAGARFAESVSFGEDTLFNLCIWSRVRSIRAIPYNLYGHTVDHSRRYELSAEEIRQKIKALCSAYERLDAVFGSNTSTERDVNITISLYPLSKILEDDSEYIALYHEYYPGASRRDFLSDMKCSPAIRAVSESRSVASRYGYDGVKLMFKKIGRMYGNQMQYVVCPFMKHRIILWMLRHKMYMFGALTVMLSDMMRDNEI